jgi:dipeptidase E
MKLYLTSLANKSIDKIDFDGKKKVAFIATAADPYEDKWFVDNDREALKNRGLEIVEFDIKDYNEEQLYNELMKFDVMFFSGGNTYYLLEKMRESGFNKIVGRLLDSGVVYVGSSAGSIVMCPNIDFVRPMDHPEEAANLKNFEGLNFVDFYFLPHFGREKYSDAHEQVLRENKDKKIVAVRDEEVVVVDGNGWKKI